MTSDHSADSLAALSAKLGPPASISLATIAGYNVSELVLWATLIYTALLIVHKGYMIYKDIKEGKQRGDAP